MKKFLIIPVFLSLTCLLRAQDKVTFMPAWTPQAQAAGYYAALEKGFYAQEGLDVTIEHIGINSSKSVMQRLTDGEVDIICSHPIPSILAISKGFHVKNVMQLTQTTAMMMVSHTPLSGPESLNGMKIGLWRTGFSEICELCCKINKLDVQFIPFLGGVNLFISGAVDATVAMSYNEYWALVEATGGIRPECTLRFNEMGYDIPEDGLYAMEDYVSRHPDCVDKFVRASRKGWDWCMEHPDEALDIVMSYTDRYGVLTNRFHQKCMLDDMFRLMVNRFTGEVDYEPVQQELFDSLVRMLVGYGYIPETVTYKEFAR